MAPNYIFAKQQVDQNRKTLFPAESTTLNSMVKSDLVTFGDGTLLYLPM